MEPLNLNDKLIKNYVRDSAAFIECWVYEDEEGGEYTLCCDQDGGEWLEN